MVLGLFCGVMTWLLIENEYLMESSIFHRLPVEYLREKFFQHENQSTLKIVWKGETIGGIALQVFPRQGPALRGTSQLIIPILGQKPSLRIEMELKLKQDYELDQLELTGKYDGMNFDVSASSKTGKLKFKIDGKGISEEHELSLADVTSERREELLTKMPSLPSLPINTKGYQLRASSVRIYRHEDWMDAYLLETRIDANSWLKIWMSPTGELLKADSSFGLTAINEDFFEPIPGEAKPAKSMTQSHFKNRPSWKAPFAQAQNNIFMFNTLSPTMIQPSTPR